MRQLSSLPRAGAAAYGSSVYRASMGVCVFCLQRSSRVSFSTTASRPIDKKAKYRSEQTARQKKFEESNAIWRTPAQLAARKQHEKDLEWGAYKRELFRSGLPIPVKKKWERRREWRLGQTEEKLTAEEKEHLKIMQKAVDKANDPNVELEDYTPATNWDGLEMVGGEAEWDTGERFQRYIPSYAPGQQLSSESDIKVATYRAVVDVFTAMAQGWNPKMLSGVSDPRGPIYHDICQVRVAVDKDASSGGELQAVRLDFPSEQVERRIYNVIERNGSSDETERPKSPLPTADLEKQIDALGSDWLAVSIADPTLKLALIKRLSTILGRHIPDFVIHSADTVGGLLSRLVRPEAPKSIHNALVETTPITELANLQIQPTKKRMTEHETAIGRWKLIRESLRDKGLPVLRGVSGWEHVSPEERRRLKALDQQDVPQVGRGQEIAEKV